MFEIFKNITKVFWQWIKIFKVNSRDRFTGVLFSFNSFLIFWLLFFAVTIFCYYILFSLFMLGFYSPPLPLLAPAYPWSASLLCALSSVSWPSLDIINYALLPFECSYESITRPLVMTSLICHTAWRYRCITFFWDAGVCGLLYLPRGLHATKLCHYTSSRPTLHNICWYKAWLLTPSVHFSLPR